MSNTPRFSIYSEYKVDTSQEEIAPHTLGQVIEPFQDGRVFVFSRNGTTALAAGNLQINADPVANHIDMTVQAAAAIGDKTVSVTLGATAATANQYAEGYLDIIDGTGQGYSYRVKSHPAASASATLAVDLYDEVQVALTTSTQASLVLNPYADVQISKADQLDTPIGVCPLVVTASTSTVFYYFWLQVAGRALVLADEALTRGDQLTIGSATGGAVEVSDAANENIVGHALESANDADHAAVMLTLR